jgi:glycerol-3-phosphate dehydrogenase (NAD(P)+)
MSATPCGILGGGAWGTALAVHIARMGAPVRLWMRDAGAARRTAAERVNRAYLPDAVLPDSVEVTAELAALAACDLVLVVVPSHGLREIARRFLAARGAGEPVVLLSGTKGIESDTLRRMTEVLSEESRAAGVDARCAVLSGPTFAAELAAGMPSAAVVAADDGGLAAALCGRLASESFRLYSSTDVVGVELGGATKNVIAVGAGLLAGLGLGHNTLAALITRGLHELARLGVACGGRWPTFAGLAGLGDLVLTCTGAQSRNRQAGIAIARGATLAELLDGRGTVAEGVRNARAIARLAAARGVEMPITEQMNAVLYEGKPSGDALRELMTRDLKVEAQL